MTFQQDILKLRTIRSEYSDLFKVPSSFNFCKSDDIGGDGGVDGDDAILFLYKGALYSVKLKDFEKYDLWKKIMVGEPKNLTRSEQLLRERMRVTGSGIIKYDYDVEHDLILTHGNTPQLITIKGCIVAEFPWCVGGVGITSSPCNPHILAYVLNGDIYMMDGRTASNYQLTFTKVFLGISAGAPPFVIQEEFDRYEGFWWQDSKCSDGVFKILYEEVNEGGVEMVHTFDPVHQSVDDYAYPRPGKPNAISTLKLLHLTLQDNGSLNIEDRHLCVPLSQLFPDCCEYIVRAGWMPGGRDEIWVQLMDRQQRHLILAVISTECFVTTTSKESEEELEKAAIMITNSMCYILWEETAEHHMMWIAVSDCLEFLPPCNDDDDDWIRFLWLSDDSGYKHLSLINATPPPSDDATQVPHGIARAKYNRRVITQGEWSILGSKVWLNAKDDLVYFQANKSAPLEKHLYVASLTNPEEPRQLTKPGFYHNITMDTTNFTHFVSVYSNMSTSINISIHSTNTDLNTDLNTACISLWHGPNLPVTYTPPTSFNVTMETGEVLYGAIYCPDNWKSGVKYPTIIYVYGGPGVQMVTCGLSRHLPRIRTWTQHGFAVVMLDNRGSTNRGTKFESYMKDQMGLFEIPDQVKGLKKACEMVDYIDTSRVGVMGWSYGGYLALMAIAQYPDIFKVCVSGAPVTDWMYYDTAYTERYLGVPPEANKVYKESSVLHYAHQFPSESGRVLIIHGLSDENVLFTHTASLCQTLVHLGKPYTLQLYTGERHGLRTTSNVLHCDATIIQFLKNNL